MTPTKNSTIKELPTKKYIKYLRSRTNAIWTLELRSIVLPAKHFCPPGELEPGNDVNLKSIHDHVEDGRTDGFVVPTEETAPPSTGRSLHKM
jgi:hypothetical protein